jgi:hypothetical protein
MLQHVAGLTTTLDGVCTILEIRVGGEHLHVLARCAVVTSCALQLPVLGELLPACTAKFALSLQSGAKRGAN